MLMPGAGEVTVLDGGLATELEANGHDLSDRLWSESLARLISSVEESLGRPSRRDRGVMSSEGQPAATFRVLGPLEVRVGEVRTGEV